MLVKLCAILFLLTSVNTFAQDSFIEVGSGGGFSGVVTVYKLLNTGEVLSGRGLGELKFDQQGKIKKAKAKKLFNACERIKRSSPSLNEPGNLYYFIAFTSEGKNMRLTWSDSSQNVPDDVRKFYDKAMSSIKSVKFKRIQ